MYWEDAASGRTVPNGIAMPVKRALAPGESRGASRLATAFISRVYSFLRLS